MCHYLFVSYLHIKALIPHMKGTRTEVRLCSLLYTGLQNCPFVSFSSHEHQHEVSFLIIITNGVCRGTSFREQRPLQKPTLLRITITLNKFFRAESRTLSQPTPKMAERSSRAARCPFHSTPANLKLQLRQSCGNKSEQTRRWICLRKARNCELAAIMLLAWSAPIIGDTDGRCQAYLRVIFAQLHPGSKEELSPI